MFFQRGTWSLRLAFPIAAFLFLFFSGFVFVPGPFCFEQYAPAPSQAFQPGEVLRYEVSWSRMLKAGTAVMEVKEETLPDGKEVLTFILTGRSRGVVDKIFPVNDKVKSVFDHVKMQSISYTISENFGRKKRHRSLVFDRDQNTVTGTLNDEPPMIFAVPARAQDGLASLYYLRTKSHFKIGDVFVIEVHDGGKNWSVEAHALGRETVKTSAGEFSTIKVRTRAVQKGAVQNKGEMLIWLTDDSRKVPVLMKSTLKIGSFIFSLKEMKTGSYSIL